MCGLGYLHQRGIYYADMKGANLLMFRSQETKLGDLGISVKLDNDDLTGLEEKYYLKGFTKGYATKLLEDAY